MKSKLPILGIASVLLLASSVPAFAFKAEPLPRSPFFQRDRFDTDLFTGGAVYSYTIPVPKGTNDLTPSVVFDYNSHGAHDFTSYVGFGWQLQRDYIERDANFTPGNTADDKFRLNFQGSSQELVEVASVYHTKTETNLHISKLTSGENNDYNEYWQVITTDGTKYTFGKTIQAELVCNGRSYVARWNLEEVEDTYGNKIFYTYIEDNGASFIDKIEYNTDESRVVDFTYAANPYLRQSYTHGCSVIEGYRLSNIQVKASENLVRQFDLSYSNPDTYQQLLQSITEKGDDGISTLPATNFEYKPQDQTWATSSALFLNAADVDAHLQLNTVALVDANGDGLADIVRSEGDTPSSGWGRWKVLLNQGNNTWATSYGDPWLETNNFAWLGRDDTMLVDVTGDNLPDIVKTEGSGSQNTWKVFRNAGRSWSSYPEKWVDNASISTYLGQTGTTIADVNGDNLADIVKTYVDGSNSVWKVFKNTGDGWNTSSETWMSSAISADLGQAYTRLIDVNGDGLPDIVKTSSDSKWRVWKNTGSHWSTVMEDPLWLDNSSLDAHFENTNIALSDVNGDGLVDIVKSVDNSEQDEWKVLMNKGERWETDWTTWVPAAANINVDVHEDNVRLADVTGDGLPDIVKTTYTNNYDTWYVWKNNGVAPDALKKITNSQGGTTSFDYSKAASAVTSATSTSSFTGEYFNNQNLSGSPTLTRTDSAISFDWGTGSPDGSISSDHFSVRWTQTVSLDGGTYVFTARSDDGVRIYVDGDLILDKWSLPVPSVMSATVSIIDGSHTIVYEYYDNDGGATAKYSYQRIGLPFPMWPATTMTVNNGLTNSQQTNDTTTYSYKYGFYKFEDREFRGFGEINTTEPNGSKKKYLFNQDNATKGRLRELQHRNSSNDPYAELEQTWSTASSSGIYTINLTGEKQYTYDGTASNPKIIETNYTYDSYGNPTKISEKGDTSISTDDRFTYFEYNPNTTAWIVNTPKKTYKNASDDSTKISETTFYYDGNTGIDDDPTKGDVTKEVKWLSGGTSPVTLYSYSSYGNLTGVTDANNHITSYAFGTNDTTHTYPDSTTNAKSQTTTFSYDLGTGNLNSQTDPNSQTTSYTYDAFGRLTKEIKPYDTSNDPTTSYTYSFDGTAPESTLVSKREVSSSSATLDVYTFTDGFGRAVQTRAEAEDTSKQNVIDTFYETNGKVKKQTVPYAVTLSSSYASPSAGIRFTQTAYDVLDRPTTITNPDETTRTNSYDHWVITKTNERGKVTLNTMGAFGKILTVQEVNGASTYTTNYEYNSRDDLTKITDHLGNEFDFTYDTLSRKTAQSDPDMGEWTYVYDGVGNLTSQTDNRDITTTRTYDELNRVTLVNYPSDTDNSYLYDVGKIGTLSIATDSAGTVFYTYDNRLRKTQEQRAINGTTKTTQFSFDAMDRIKTTTYPDGEVVTNTFNAQGEINSASGSADIMSNIDYNALGKITKKEFANGLDTDYTYNSTDFRLNRIQTGSLQDLNYTYDAIGNVKTIANSITSKTETFTYDDLDRLKTATESAGYDYAYTYDAIGNLTKFTNDGEDIDYTYGEGSAGPHALTSSTEQKYTATVNPSEDTYVDASATSSNYGSDTSLAIDGDPVKISFLKFDLSQFAGATVSSAKLRLYVANESLDSQIFKEVSTNSWAEGTMTYSNKPSLTSTTIATVTDASTPSVWKEVDITAAINAHKGETYSIGVESSGADGLSFNSSEATSNRPELVVTYLGEATGTSQTSVRSTSSNSASTGTAISVSAPSGVQAGDVVVVFVHGNGQNTIADNNGSTSFTEDVNDYKPNTTHGHTVSVFSRRIQSGDPSTYNFTLGSSNRWSIVAVAVQNPNTSTIYDVSPTTDNNGDGDDTDFDAPSITTQTADAIHIAMAGLDSGSATVNGTPSGYTSVTENDQPMGVAYKTITSASATGAKNFTFTGDTSSAIGVSLAIKSAAAPTSIAFDAASNSGEKTSVTSSTHSHTVGASLSNSILLVGTSTRDTGNADYPITGVTYNGSALTKVRHDTYDNSGTDGGQLRTELWYLVNPPSGAHNIVVTFTGTVTRTTIGAVSLSGVDQSSPVDAQAGSNSAGQSSPLSTSITVATANSWLFDAVYSKTGGAITVGSGQTQRWNVPVNSSGDQTGGSTKLATATGSTNMQWTYATADDYVQSVVSVKPATSVSGTALSYTYDANGNMTSDGTKCYEFNDANQLKKAKWCSGSQTIAEYVYDGSGNRMVKKHYNYGTLMHTVYSWSDLFETKVYASGGSAQSTSYYFINNELVSKKDNAGARTYFHNDHLGSTTVVTNQAGTLVEQTKYDPWGEVYVGGTVSKFQYTGQERDTETGLNYYGARYYDPHIRRFTQADPVIQNVFDPQALNRYAYVRNNPLRYTDPSGHIFEEILNKIASVFTGGGSAPKPASTAKLPDNIPNKPINLSNTGGSNPIAYTNEKNSPSILTQWGNAVAENGHIAISASLSKGAGAGGGVKYNKQGTTQSVSVALGTDVGPKVSQIRGVGFGGSILFSTYPVQQNSFSKSVSINAIIAAQWSSDLDGQNGWRLEAVGAGCCGFEFSTEYTGKTIPYNEVDPNEAVKFRSLKLEEFYGK